MAIEFTHLVGDWRRIVEDYVTDPENNADAPGVEGTITVSPVLGEGRHAPRGVPSGGVFYTFAPLDLRVYRGLLMDENMNSDITVAIEVDGYPIAWRAKFDLQYRRIKIPLQDVIFGPNEIVAGQINLSSLVARDGVPPEYEGSYVQLMDAVAQAAAARDAAEGHADRAEGIAAGVESAAQIVTDNVDAINDLPANIAAVNTARAGAESAQVAAAGSESAAATSAAVAATQATLAGEKAGDAASSATASAGSASASAGSATAAATSASAAAGSATGADTARAAAVVARTGAETARTGAETARDAADGHADRAETAADSFGLAATATTGAAGSNAAVTVTGDGPAYALGFTVPRGDKGATGAKGDKGDTGDIGPKGDKGDTGDRGLQGERGLQGIQGEQGPRGLQGEKGDKGDPGPKGDRGDDGEVSQAMLDAAVASLVDGAPEALDTLTELADALGNDPNFATTVSTEIGKRALIDGAPAAYNTLGKLVTALQNHELGGSTDASLLTGALTDQVDASDAMVTGVVGGNPATLPLSQLVTTTYSIALNVPEDIATYPGRLSSLETDKSDVGHKHTKAEVGLGNVDNTSDAAKPVSTATQAALTPLQSRVGVAPATWRWDGTTLPTAASQVHAQARAGDFIVAPNLTTDPGWHQITGV